MLLPGTTGKKQVPASQQQLNMSTHKYGGDVSALSVGAGSQNSSNNGFLSNKRGQIKSMANGFMQA